MRNKQVSKTRSHFPLIPKKAYQKVAFFRGAELYSEGAYADAVALFEKSLKEPIDPVFTARATS